MAHPKRKSSRSRRRLRRTHKGEGEPSFTKCPRCDNIRRPHTVCDNCGYYKERKVLERDEF